jgi:hypothetical protein
LELGSSWNLGLYNSTKYKIIILKKKKVFKATRKHIVCLHSSLCST